MGVVLSQTRLELTAVEGEHERMRFSVDVVCGDIEEKSALGREGIFDVPCDRLRG
jgi:hypothetical protein